MKIRIFVIMLHTVERNYATIEKPSVEILFHETEKEIAHYTVSLPPIMLRRGPWEKSREVDNNVF